MNEERIEQLSRRALRHRSKGEFRKAANVYGELTSIAPERSRFWVLRAAALVAHGQRDEAARCLRQSLWLLHRAHEDAREGAVRALLTGLAVVAPAQLRHRRTARLQLHLAA